MTVNHLQEIEHLKRCFAAREALRRVLAEGCPNCAHRPSVLSLARQLGIHKSSLYKFWAGHRRSIKASSLVSLEQWLHRVSQEHRCEHEQAQGQAQAAPVEEVME